MFKIQLLRTASFLAAMTVSSGLFAQVKVGSNPNTITNTSNLEVEATDGKKVIVNKANGTVVIQNTPTGATTDNLLTVDENGNVRAIASPNTIPTNVYVLAKQNSSVSLPNSQNFSNRITIPLRNEIADTNNAWDPATSTFTAPEDGFYLINFNFMVDYDGTAIYSGSNGYGGFLQIGILKSAGSYTGTASTNNGVYYSSFQGEDSGTPNPNLISPNYGGGVFNITLYFKKGEQLVPKVAQANGMVRALSSNASDKDNFISITKL